MANAVLTDRAKTFIENETGEIIVSAYYYYSKKEHVESCPCESDRKIISIKLSDGSWVAGCGACGEHGEPADHFKDALENWNELE